MKIVFMGTPDFAAGILDSIRQAGHEILLVVTQPDKPKGRSGKRSPSPVKEYALAHGIRVFQPVKIRDEAAVEVLKKAGADLFVVAAFGQILSQEVLDIPPLGCVNVHASLLPKYRGAAPIQQAILDGEKESGVTIMQMERGCDTGPILLQRAIPISPEDTGGSLFDKLAQLGAQLMVEALPEIGDGSLKPQPQDTALATNAGKISKESGQIDWKKDAASIERQVRGLNPWPSAYTSLHGKMLKVWKSRISDKICSGKPGEVISSGEEGILVCTGKGALLLTEVQLAGKKRMTAGSFLMGHPLKPGVLLGNES